MDTFNRDSLLVLRRLGVEAILDKLTTTEQAEKELETLTEYNFQLLQKTENMSNCTTPLKLAQMLWRVLKMNGYLASQDDYAAPVHHADLSASSIQRHFLNSVLRSLHRQSRSKSDMRNQKQRMMRNAYKDVSPILMDRVRDVYSIDFKLFGYNTSPFDDTIHNFS